MSVIIALFENYLIKQYKNMKNNELLSKDNIKVYMNHRFTLVTSFNHGQKRTEAREFRLNSTMY